MPDLFSDRCLIDFKHSLSLKLSLKRQPYDITYPSGTTSNRINIMAKLLNPYVRLSDYSTNYDSNNALV